MVSKGGRGSKKLELVKKAIIAVAKEKEFSRHQYYKITDTQIWGKILDLGYDRYIEEKQVHGLRAKLPKGYSNSYFR